MSMLFLKKDEIAGKESYIVNIMKPVKNVHGSYLIRKWTLILYLMKIKSILGQLQFWGFDMGFIII